MAQIKCMCGKENGSHTKVCPICGTNVKQTTQSTVPARASGLKHELSSWQITLILVGGLVVCRMIFVMIFGDNSASTERAATPEINATIHHFGSVFIVQNNDAFDWKNCKIDVNSGAFGGGGYMLTVQVIQPGESKIVDTSDMANDSGERFNPVTHMVKQIVVTCDTAAGRQFTGRNIENVQ